MIKMKVYQYMELILLTSLILLGYWLILLW